MRVSSTAFADGAAIPRHYTCDGENTSPSLAWSDAPPGTQSFVLLCDDPDAPSGTWHHWAAYDVPASFTTVAADAARHAERYGFMQGVNDFNRVGYDGPCPPRGHGPHHYRFRVMALSVGTLPVHSGATCRDVELKALKHVLAEAVLTGIYER